VPDARLEQTCAHPSCRCTVFKDGPYGRYCSQHRKEKGRQVEFRRRPGRGPGRAGLSSTRHPAPRWRRDPPRSRSYSVAAVTPDTTTLRRGQG